jgi:membrane-bound ClpP family serine protease
MNQEDQYLAERNFRQKFCRVIAFMSLIMMCLGGALIFATFSVNAIIGKEILVDTQLAWDFIKLGLIGYFSSMIICAL